MSNTAKARGTSFETMILQYMRWKGFNRTYRPATKGLYDSGDINGIASNVRQAILQCKNQKAFKLADWLNDTVEQAKQHDVGGDALPILVVKRPRVGNANLGDTYAVLRLEDLVGLMKEAGYQ